jgi:hypothetical protein
LGKEHSMSDAELPDGALRGPDEVDQGNTDNDEDEEPVIPRDDNRTVTNDAVAGEPVQPGVAPDDVGAEPIQPIYADNDLEDEEIDLDDTLEWGQIDSPPAGGTGSVDS